MIFGNPSSKIRYAASASVASTDDHDRYEETCEVKFSQYSQNMISKMYLNKLLKRLESLPLPIRLRFQLVNSHTTKVPQYDRPVQSKCKYNAGQLKHHKMEGVSILRGVVSRLSASQLEHKRMLRSEIRDDSATGNDFKCMCQCRCPYEDAEFQLLNLILLVVT